MSRPQPVRCTLSLAVIAVLASCSVHSRATHWNQHVGPDGQPVFVLQSTYFGLRFVALLPLAGSTTIDRMIAQTTARIPAEEGANLRLVETECSNYWYALPPLSWLISPVMTSVSIEYRPTPAALAREGVVAAEQALGRPAR